MSTDASRQELATFLRSRRERITPAEVGLPAGPRRRTQGLRREEVAVLAGVSPTWYTYLEQGRGIQPSQEVLDSLARVLRLSEDERRYVHSLAHGVAIQTSPLDADVPAADLIKQVVELFDESPYPVYAANHYCDLLAWNRAALEWYDDWGALRPEDRNIVRWMLLSPVARVRLADWEEDTRDAVARWRSESARHSADPVLRARIKEFTRLSPEFRTWWGQHQVVEHRSKVRRFRHDRLGVRNLKIVPMISPETVPAGVVLHVPLAGQWSGTSVGSVFR
ncbi:MAG: helix-turn-helix transcriptional regulator [Actinophytocola sp.]|uniref:helix-turn-helix transcriptional regulator n=1 Tax=Actinophytocola sp. TaxID=1872138 RepID=UPI003C75801F